MQILGTAYADKAEACTALMDAIQGVPDGEAVDIGSYRGFGISVRFTGFTHKLSLKGAIAYNVELGTDAHGNLVRIDNALDKIPERLLDYETSLTNLLQQQEAAKAEVGKPFQYEEELQQKSARLAELDVELNISGKQQEIA